MCVSTADSMCLAQLADALIHIARVCLIARPRTFRYAGLKENEEKLQLSLVARSLQCSFIEEARARTRCPDPTSDLSHSPLAATEGASVQRSSSECRVRNPFGFVLWQHPSSFFALTEASWSFVRSPSSVFRYSVNSSCLVSLMLDAGCIESSRLSCVLVVSFRCSGLRHMYANADLSLIQTAYACCVH